MDTITYLPDPAVPGRMSSCIVDYARFSKAHVRAQLAKYSGLIDEYDEGNDANAIDFLCNSIDADLKKVLTDDCEGERFAVWFTTFIDRERKATTNQHEALRQSLKAVSLSSFPGDDLDKMWSHIKPTIDELEACIVYDHHITRSLAETLLDAGGNGLDVLMFRFSLQHFIARLDTALMEIQFFDIRDKDAHMIREKLTPRDLFDKAREEYSKLLNDGKWPAAANMKRLTGSPSINLASTTVTPSTITEAFANVLIQVVGDKQA